MNTPLSSGAEKLLSDAAEESSNENHHFIGVEHLFLGLAQSQHGAMEKAFASQQFNIDDFSRRLREKVRGVTQRSWGEEIIFTPRCQAVLHIARRIAERRGKREVEPDHIVEAIFRENRSIPVRLLRSMGVDIYELQASLAKMEPRRPRKTPTPLIDQLGRDLTEAAREGRLGALIGREKELDLIAQVLLRKNKNNPVLIGEAGVGKTAVVEGFARYLITDACPEPLRHFRVIELTTGTLVAGTKFRGEFEERLLGICREAKEHPEIILFLDEIHTLVGAGATSGDSMDASNIMKPALARGEIRCLGATTIQEYRRFIEKDSALDRRFERILVEEPSIEEALQILEGVRQSLEAHHKVHIDRKAIKAAIGLTVQHVPDRHLPDKAMDALDQSCARVRLQVVAGTEKSPTLKDGAPLITEEDVTVTVSQWTGIPLARMSGEEAKNVLNLGEQIRARIIGQDHAVRAVTRCILTAKAGLAAPHRPMGVFLFLGPTGVGKTELAKSLAEVLFGSERRLIRFDMSEFSEQHSVSKLIGAPPGYVGYEKEGLLISKVRTHPHSVVLFDEVEKAHPQVFDLFLQIFDDGRLSGSHGLTADFTQSIVILTSNVNTTPALRAKVGFGVRADEPPEQELDPRVELKGHFRPELINRLDEVVVFHPLERPALRGIIDRFIGEIEEALQDRGLHLELDDKVYDYLIKHGSSEEFGARELRRAVDRLLRQPLASQVLGLGDEVGTIRVTLQDESLHFAARSGR